MKKTNDFKVKVLNLPKRYKAYRNKLNQIAHHVYLDSLLSKGSSFIEESKEDLKTSKTITQKINISEVTETYYEYFNSSNELSFRQMINALFYIYEKKSLSFMRDDKDFLEDQLKMYNKK
ncbi:hypothetical protein [Arcobacter porcinus]|uniref:Uncharacterized protein n=1 Tax=Arcobacter porcinus TaxID=1935204 RepID=A0A5C2HDC1_9BACT|nr:hypothetical protein [Arcobacter porcinus]OCL81904.1 hypothetical protein AAW29_01612 [Arcobacter porcinus]OCL86252.1 hypothetical protein AAX30_01596 [Arcobacter porcinus]OCL94199.1 hypothetical protein AAX27_00989 [Aliarcobacter thereius]QEP40903.1 hypothetical protein APORC_1311 [Arcobacter porcinus]